MKTRITIDAKTAWKLKKIMDEGDTYDSIILELLCVVGLGA
jgi:hypothetical protein